MNVFCENIKVIFFFLLFGTFSAQATIYPVSLDQRIENATQIVLGKVVQQYAFWDNEKQNIYTAHLLEIDAYLKKANNKNYVEVVTLGGVVEEEAQIVYPNIQMDVGHHYLVFLKNPSSAAISKTAQGRSSQTPRFEPYAHAQGILPEINHQLVDYFDKQPVATQKILLQIQSITQFVARRPSGALFATTSPSTPYFSKGRKQVTLKSGDGKTASHFHAGTANEAEELIIEGSGFGNTPGIIQFSNADAGGLGFINSTYGTDLIYWTDSEIRVKVPSKAGTGFVQIHHHNGRLVGNVPIRIEWAVNPVFSTYRGYDERMRQRVEFLNNNENGGYTLQVNTTNGFLADQQAMESFERALNRWQCQTGVNFQLDKSGTSTTYGNDGNCIIQYSTDLPRGVLGIATSRYKSVGSTSCTREKTLWFLKEFDIQFAPNSALLQGFSWNFSARNPTEDQYDFESIAMHELGHAHGLGHIVGEENVMHYAIGSGDARKALSEKEIAAGLHKMSYSTQSNCLSRFLPMESLATNCQAVNLLNTAAKVKLFLEGSYNGDNGQMNTFLADNDLLPVNQPFDQAPYFYEGTEFIENLPEGVSDWVLLQLRSAKDMEEVLVQKALLIKNDGMLTNVDGNEELLFNELPIGEYYIAIFHRSHLPVISRGPHLFDNEAALYDFTINESAAMGTAQQKTKQAVAMMNVGDFDGNGVINSQDFNLWKQNSAAINVYLPADADGNGIINNQDFNLWKLNRSKIGLISIDN
ncbi:MAG: matrixin family metalloprotease [Bacteroidota bacterium]